MQQHNLTETATLGGGCFWCLEAIFNELRGVEKVEPGYSGGSVSNPSYREVCTGNTGHAEVIRITFDPEIISFREILDIFFTIHNPTTLNRQGADMGTQYRSVIFFHTPEQEKVAQEVKAELEASKLWDSQIVTEIAPFTAFYPAEEYHREYFRCNPEEAYCRIVIEPKVAKFRKKYLAKLKT
jgi:peptide-methionine (S)-S-oxide reductase